MHTLEATTFFAQIDTLGLYITTYSKIYEKWKYQYHYARANINNRLF